MIYVLYLSDMRKRKRTEASTVSRTIIFELFLLELHIHLLIFPVIPFERILCVVTPRAHLLKVFASSVYTAFVFCLVTLIKTVYC